MGIRKEEAATDVVAAITFGRGLLMKMYCLTE